MAEDRVQKPQNPQPGINLGDGLAWLASQPDNSLDGIFTDPPWGVTSVQIAGQDSWRGLLAILLREGARVVRRDGHLLIWYSQNQLDTFLRFLFTLPGIELYLNALMVIQHGGSVMIPLDFIFCLGRRHRTLKLHSWVLTADTFREGDRLHPAERPQNVVTRVLREWFRPGQKICDPFAGSNTAGWAAKRIGIDCYSFEINADMFQTALEREKQLDLFAEEAKK